MYRSIRSRCNATAVRQCLTCLVMSWFMISSDALVGRQIFSLVSKSTSSLSQQADCDIDEAFLPYAGKQPAEALPEIFVAKALPDVDNINEEMLWVPQTETVSFRPLCFSVSSGYYVNLLRVKGAGVLSRHKHPGPVHGHVLKGKWRYLEHEWTATEGSYVFEPPGSLLYCDVDGNVIGAEDVFTKLELAKKHYASIGLGENFVEQFVR